MSIMKPWDAVYAAQASFDERGCRGKYEGTDESGTVPGLVTIKQVDIEEKKKFPDNKAKKDKVTAIAWGQGESDYRLAVVDQLGNCMVWNTVKACKMYGCIDSFAQSVAISPDKENPVMLVGGMRNHTVMYKKNDADSALMAKTKTWSMHDGYISSIHFIDDKKYISASGDADIRVFDISADPSNCLQVLRGHEKDAQSIKFPSDSGKRDVFITCSSDKTVKMWDLRCKAAQKTFFSDSELNACAINGNLIACGGVKDKTYLFDVRAGPREVGKYARNNQQTASCEFSKSGRALYIGHDDGSIIVWDIFGKGDNKQYALKKEAHTTKVEPGGNPDVTKSRVQALEVGPLGYLASGGFDGTVRIWGSPRA